MPAVRRTSFVLLLAAALPLAADEAHKKQYEALVKPLVEGFCYKCHGPEKQKGDLNLADHASYESVLKNPKLWGDIRDRVMAFEMPPEGSAAPEGPVRDQFLDWLRKIPKPELDCEEIASDRNTSFYRGSVMSRRLTREEYERTVRDLTGLQSLQVAHLLPADAAGGEGFDTTGDTLFSTPLAVETYLQSAETIARTLLPDDLSSLPPEAQAARQQLLCAEPSEKVTPRAAAQSVLTRFVRLAFRRPVTPEDTAKFLALYDRGAARGDSHTASLRLALTGVLIAPAFLFLVEPEPAEYGVQPLGPYPLASRLAYFLWSSMPDEELFAAAASGAILQDDTLRAQIRRMLQHPRSASLGERFASQWLELDRVGGEVRPDAKKYPEFTDALAASMRREVTTFFNHLIRENRPLTELIDSDYTFADQRLAALYGVEVKSGEAFEKVTFQTKDRGGLLGMAAISTSTSFPLRTSPVLRGKWVLDVILGERVPPPPPDVPALKEEAVNSAASLREQLAEHRKNPDCASCHNKMDPLGFGMESYDVLGRLRPDIDASGTLPNGRSFSGPAGLKQVLMERKDQILRHLMKKLTGYALGRELNRYDECIIREAMKALQSGEHRPLGTIEAIVLSKPFRFRYYPKSD
jgi:hypothetical protein